MPAPCASGHDCLILTLTKPWNISGRWPEKKRIDKGGRRKKVRMNEEGKDVFVFFSSFILPPSSLSLMVLESVE
jgi:hypothetical protein